MLVSVAWRAKCSAKFLIYHAPRTQMRRAAHLIRVHHHQWVQRDGTLRKPTFLYRSCSVMSPDNKPAIGTWWSHSVTQLIWGSSLVHWETAPLENWSFLYPSCPIMSPDNKPAIGTGRSHSITQWNNRKILQGSSHIIKNANNTKHTILDRHSMTDKKIQGT